MARPTKDGLDYFPLDVDIDQDEKVALIEAQHGPLGFAIIIKLFMKIYKNSYYYEWGEKEQLLFSKIINVDINKINEVINDCIKWDLFNKDVFEKHGILTSKGIQLRYLEASGRRKEPKIIQEYCLLSRKQLNDFNYLVIVNINYETVEVIDNRNTQSKVKESKVNNNYKKEYNKEPTDNDFQKIVKAFNNNIYPIGAMEAEKLSDWLDDLEADVIILAIEEAVSNNVRTMKYIETILNDWHKKGFKAKEAVLAYLKDRRKKKEGGQYGGSNTGNRGQNQSKGKYDDIDLPGVIT